MNMSPPSGPPPLAKERHLPNHLLILGITGAIIAALLVLGAIVLVNFEQKHRAEEGIPKLASPTPLAQNLLTSSPTPLPTYQPQVSGLTKQQAVNLLTATTIDPTNEDTGDHLLRWERNINVKIRGQGRPEDQSCLSRATSELSQSLETVEINIVDIGSPEDIVIYFLPRDQFSSVDVDLPQEIPASAEYRFGPDFSINWGRSVIDSTQPAQERCFYTYQHLLSLLGIRYKVDGNYANSYITTQPIPATSRYSQYDLEVVRALYSPLLISGLSTTEVERRLLAQ